MILKLMPKGVRELEIWIQIELLMAIQFVCGIKYSKSLNIAGGEDSLLLVNVRNANRHEEEFKVWKHCRAYT